MTEKTEVKDRDILDFFWNVSPYPYGDTTTAIKKFRTVGLYGDDLADLVMGFCENTDTKLEGADVCAVAFDHILQKAREKIIEVLDFDIQEDVDFSVEGNHMYTSIGHNDSDRKELDDLIQGASRGQKEKLANDKFVLEFLNDVEIKIKITA